MASVERTAYPRFKRLISERELNEFFSPSEDDIAWASGLTRTRTHLLALVVMAKTCGRLGYFPALEATPNVVVAHVGVPLTSMSPGT